MVRPEVAATSPCGLKARRTVLPWKTPLERGSALANGYPQSVAAVGVAADTASARSAAANLIYGTLESTGIVTGSLRRSDSDTSRVGCERGQGHDPCHAA